MRICFCLGLIGLLLAVSCGPPKPAPEAAGGRYPYDLQVEVNDQTMTVAWKTAGEGLFVGYYVYINDQPLAKKYPGPELPDTIEPFNHTPFAGDTEPEDGIEHFEAEGLENGKTYYVSVRVVNADRSLSKPSREIAVSCGPRGEMTLQTRYQGGQDGFSFPANQHVRANAVENDLYYYSKDGVDYLTSPSRLDGFLRQTKFMRLAVSGDLSDVARKVQALTSVPTDDRVAVKKGDWVWMVMPEGGYALVKVLGFEGVGNRREIRLYYAFDPSGRPPLI